MEHVLKPGSGNAPHLGHLPCLLQWFLRVFIQAISAAQGNKDTIDKLLTELPKLTKYEKDRAVEYGKKEKASAEKIIEEAKKPKFERTVILTLDDHVDTALTKAGQKLSMDREEIATMALEKWLEENGFFRQ